MDELRGVCSITGMDFRSDNTSGVSPAIMAALAAANTGTASGYGDDPISQRLNTRIAEIFEHEVTVFPVATGTAANSLALATVTPNWGVIYCHEGAHIANDECGAPEFYTGGGSLIRIPGEHGKLAPAEIESRIAGAGRVHNTQPAAISLSQATETGGVYTPAQLGAISELAKRHKLALHVDGARFANAIAALGCSPADLSWKSGIDVLSFGATKNGAMAAEAVIYFGAAHTATFGYRRKRAGHLFSKMRYLSAQLDAYLTDDLWLKNARNANAMASKLGAGLAAINGLSLLYPVEANEVFVNLPDAMIRTLEAEGFGFYRWGGPTATCLRLVTSFQTTEADVTKFVAAAKKHAR
ncbi:MAG TPA: low specificity L-threonine aldolase [Magnetospirillaceae bacterium]|jgi:threonine aldolase